MVAENLFSALKKTSPPMKAGLESKAKKQQSE
jgi:hypothetical protein